MRPLPIAGKTLVTGASGFIGRAVVERLLSEGREVVALSRHPLAAHGLPSVVVRDYEDAAALAAIFGGCDSVIHLAALAHSAAPAHAFEGNLIAARCVATAAVSAGVRRLVLVSSIGVNGNTTRGKPFSEDDVPAPVEPYARSKWQAEQEVQSVTAGSLTEWVIVRPPLVYGRNAPGNFGKLVRAVAGGWPLPFARIHNRRSLVGLDNLVALLMLCTAHPSAANELFVAADGDDLSTPDLVRSIARGLGREARMWPLPPAWLEGAAALVGRSSLAQSLCESLQVDATKARRLLGWSPAVPARHGIEQAAASWRSA